MLPKMARTHTLCSTKLHAQKFLFLPQPLIICLYFFGMTMQPSISKLHYKNKVTAFIYPMNFTVELQ